MRGLQSRVAVGAIIQAAKGDSLHKLTSEAGDVFEPTEHRLGTILKTDFEFVVGPDLGELPASVTAEEEQWFVQATSSIDIGTDEVLLETSAGRYSRATEWTVVTPVRRQVGIAMMSQSQIDLAAAGFRGIGLDVVIPEPIEIGTTYSYKLPTDNEMLGRVNAMHLISEAGKTRGKRSRWAGLMG